MVRRWSCLNEINISLKSTFFFKKTYRILTFRRTIHFKKYVRKVTITKLKRKSLIKMKHKANWWPYFYVLRLWCKDFLIARQLASFQYINKCYLNSFYFYNFNRPHVTNNFIANNFNFIYASIPLKLYLYLNKGAHTYLHGNNVNIAFCDETPIFDKTAVPAFYDWSHQLIAFDERIKIDFNFNEILDCFFEFNLFKLLELNKILIILLFMNLSKFKNVK